MNCISGDHTARASYSLARNCGAPPSADIVYKTPSPLHRIRCPSGDHDGAKLQKLCASTMGFSPEPTRSLTTDVAPALFRGPKLNATQCPSGDHEAAPANPSAFVRSAGEPPATGDIQRCPGESFD